MGWECSWHIHQFLNLCLNHSLLNPLLNFIWKLTFPLLGPYTSRCGIDEAPASFLDVAASINIVTLWNNFGWTEVEHSEDFTCGNEMRLMTFNMVNRHLVLDGSSCKAPETISWGQVSKLLSFAAIFVCSHSIASLPSQEVKFFVHM